MMEKSSKEMECGFKWKGGECGYMTKELAEKGLEKLSGNS